MFVKGFFWDGWVSALNQAGWVVRLVSGLAWVDTTGKSHPDLGGTLVGSHTLTGSGYVRGRGRQVIGCTTRGCEPVRSGQTPTG